MQSKMAIAYFSEKLNGSRCNYNTYNKELYVIVRVLTHQVHHLKLRPFYVAFRPLSTQIH